MKKRTKKKSSGLGDTVADFTGATGLDRAAEAIARAFGNGDCGCKRRQEKLNQLFPYDNKKQD